jgi:surfactin synthase thioesterase subunit
MSYSLAAESVLPLWGSRPRSTRITLFCLPHAGGGASAYRRLAMALRPEIDLQPVQLPGREELAHLSAIEDAAVLVDVLGTALLPVLDRPFGLFGHSLGAAMAAELVAWFAAAGAPRPELLVASARTGDFRAGEISRRDRAGAMLDDRELLSGMMRLGGTARAVLDDEQLRALVLRVLRNDMRMAGTYRPSFDRLTVPVIACGGTEDVSVPIPQLASWQHRTAQRFRFCLFPGGHFYLYEQSQAMAEVILAELDPSPDKMTREIGLSAGPASGTPSANPQ